jgi:choline dehydrogenase
VSGLVSRNTGIGPKATLDSYQIPVISDLPGVGQNLRDPVNVGVARFVNTPSAQAIVANPALKPEALRQYYEEAAGPYSSVAGYIAFDRLPADLRATLPAATQAKLAAMPADQPELQYVAGVIFTGNNTIGSTSATISNVFSRGSVTISSASISDQPVIDLGWFSDPADSDVLVAGIKRLRQAWATEPAQTISAGPEARPGVAIDTDEEMLAYIKSSAQQMWHASSTCAMGKKKNQNAVVDSKARVFGVKNLRVVDMSILPFSLPGQPQSTVYALAEKIAEAIKNES